MLRASDIFGRRAGVGVNKPTMPTVKAEKRDFMSTGGDGYSRTWDPATGKYYDEELPADVAAMMGFKKPKVQVKSELDPWSTPRKTPGGALGPAAVGLGKTPVAPKGRAPGGGSKPIAGVDETAPSVEFRGFSKVELNDRYFEKANVKINDRPTYWNATVEFFIYWQLGDRWALCDAQLFAEVKQGQMSGWAYKEDSRHFSFANGWKEAWNGTWQEPDLEVTTRSFSGNEPQWDSEEANRNVETVEFRGFTMKELNSRYHLKPDKWIQGRPSYWDISGVYFIYWQQSMLRWAICDLKCLEAVKEGQCPGWAYRGDNGHFANACNWMEQREGEWQEAYLETGVVRTCTKGLKIELAGFSKEDLNAQYIEKPEEEIQGKASFWDYAGTYFIYWQSSMNRWAICDSASLRSAKSGLSPGWAYKTDSRHFAKTGDWMEAYGREWQIVQPTCKVLEGYVREDPSMVKAELSEEAAAATSEQYTSLITQIYEDKNPSKLKDLPKLLQKYEGKESELYKMVCEKYEVDKEAMLKNLSDPDSGPGRVTQSAGKVKAELGAAAPESDPYAMYEDEELPQLSAREYCERIQAVYVAHNPTKLQVIGALLAKWRNRERELYFECCTKYNEHPVKFHYKYLQEGQ
mmetsp:Transcript_102224/g.192344  ORF Transcript_102224/g.192344 Transcript_102224/m.192344 type:complete len:633 (+) Transcript_102224:140-2038(+)